MNKLLLMTTLAAAFGASSMTSAQPRRGARPVDTDAIVVVRRTQPRPPRYEPVRAFPDRPRRRHDQGARGRVYAERQDLHQIVDIARAWRRAAASRDRHLQYHVDRRLDRWLAHEIRETRYRPNSYHRRRIVELSRELDMLHWRLGHGRAHRVDYRRKALILDELVSLSEARVRRATNNAYADDWRLGRPVRY